jgi:hypothetical protein
MGAPSHSRCQCSAAEAMSAAFGAGPSRSHAEDPMHYEVLNQTRWVSVWTRLRLALERSMVARRPRIAIRNLAELSDWQRRDIGLPLDEPDIRSPTRIVWLDFKERSSAP